MKTFSRRLRIAFAVMSAFVGIGFVATPKVYVETDGEEQDVLAENWPGKVGRPIEIDVGWGARPASLHIEWVVGNGSNPVVSSEVNIVDAEGKRLFSGSFEALTDEIRVGGAHSVALAFADIDGCGRKELLLARQGAPVGMPVLPDIDTEADVQALRRSYAARLRAPRTGVLSLFKSGADGSYVESRLDDLPPISKAYATLVGWDLKRRVSRNTLWDRAVFPLGVAAVMVAGFLLAGRRKRQVPREK